MFKIIFIVAVLGLAGACGRDRNSLECPSGSTSYSICDDLYQHCKVAVCFGNRLTCEQYRANQVGTGLASPQAGTGKCDDVVATNSADNDISYAIGN